MGGVLFVKYIGLCVLFFSTVMVSVGIFTLGGEFRARSSISILSNYYMYPLVHILPVRNVQFFQSREKAALIDVFFAGAIIAR